MLMYLQRPFTISELRQALQIHYDVEGDDLLSEDNSIPYADKDFSLISGSLLDVSDGTLQVIHLTVKDFLISQSSNQRYPALPATRSDASRTITTVCLRCIKLHCWKPIMDIGDRESRLDIALDLEATANRAKQIPFLDYAAVSWLVLNNAEEKLVITICNKTLGQSPNLFVTFILCNKFFILKIKCHIFVTFQKKWTI